MPIRRRGKGPKGGQFMPGEQCEQVVAEEPLEVADSLSGLSRGDEAFHDPDPESWATARETAAKWKRSSPWEYPTKPPPSSHMETTIMPPSGEVVVRPFYLDDRGWLGEEPPYRYGQQHHIVSNTSEPRYSKVPPNAAVIMNTAGQDAPERVLDEYPGCRYVVQEDEDGLGLWHRDGRRFRLTVEEGPSEITPEMVASACYALEVNGQGILSERPRTVTYGPHSRRWSAQQVPELQTRPSLQDWTDAQEEASRLSHEYSDALKEAVASDDFNYYARELVAAREAALGATHKELRLRREYLGGSRT